jgi:predicted transposase/invertase (TIGR01784 family)
MTDKPHDALFRGTFSQLEHAASELASVLPAELSARIDWASLSLEPGRFVSERLEGRVTDLLYSARLRGGGEVRLLVLFEHQSTEQPRMALRLLDYMVTIWKHLEAELGAAEPLPPIVPVVLHNGERPWTAPRSLRPLFGLDVGDW